MSERALLGALALALAACAPAGGAPDERAAVTSAGVDGTLDADATYSGVLGLMSRKGDLLARCTGVLIAPDLLLTARHCVSLDTTSLVVCAQSPLGDAVEPEDVLVTSLSAMSDEAEDYVAAAEIYFAPGGDDTCGFDLAAVRLIAAPGASFYPPRLDAVVEPGEAFTAVGFGSGLESGEIGVRRFAQGSVACAGGDCPLAEVQSNEWLAEDGAFCRSDSGAAALDADGALLGVVSRGQDPCATPILAALPSWRPWLLDVARATAESAGYETPEWAKEPEPVEPVDDGPEPQPASPPLASSCAVSVVGAGQPAWAWLVLLLSAQLARFRRNRRRSSWPAQRAE